MYLRAAFASSFKYTQQDRFVFARSIISLPRPPNIAFSHLELDERQYVLLENDHFRRAVAAVGVRAACP
ncbi:MAG TPA: hypothetical protein DC054_14035 [Blastocatellia bacterium]|nr:hypothetical protein [Blastocatellia bacterium]